MAGINRATSKYYATESFLDSVSTALTPCIFLSHSSKDKKAVREIGEYIMVYGNIDIYLDENDAELQNADKNNDPIRVTQSIERGILTSTHLMCIVSENTQDSWWVPYEIGFAKQSSKGLATLKLKGGVYLPSYLKITEIILGTKSLNPYLHSIGNRPILDSIALESLCESNIKNHPLDNYLDLNQ